MTADGLDGTQSDGLTVTNVADCSNGPAGSNLCIEDAKYLAWPVAADRDVVFAVDSAPTPACRGVRSAQRGRRMTLTAMPATLPIPANTSIRSLHSGDVDGDGTADLIATFAPGPKDPTSSAVLVCQMSSSGIPSGCVDLAPKVIAVAPMTVACLDAAPGRLGYRDPSMTPSLGVDLLVLCRDTGSTLYRVTKTADDYAVDRADSRRGLARCDPGRRRHRRRCRRRGRRSRAKPVGGRSWCFRSARRATPRPARARGRNNVTTRTLLARRGRARARRGHGTRR